MAEYKKLTINLSPEVHEELKQLAEAQDCTLTELIKRSVALNKYVWEHRDAEILVKDGDRTDRLVIFGM